MNTAAAGLLPLAVRKLRAGPLGLPIGSQTYPHRQRIKDGDFAGLCRDLAGLGVGNIELCSPGYGEFAGLTDAKQTRKIVEDHGLKCPSAHFDLRELRTRQQQSIAWAHDIGMTQMGTASLNGHVENGATTMDVVKRAADEYNKIAEVAAEGGHAAVPARREVRDVQGRWPPGLRGSAGNARSETGKDAVPDVGDAGGRRSRHVLHKYPGRFLSMHLQGVAQDLHPAQERRAAVLAGVAVGKDSLDWAKIFAAAKTGGVKNYFVEQNWELTVQSVAYLKTLKA